MKKTLLSIAIVCSLFAVSCGTKEAPKEEQPVTEKVKVINTTHAYICPMDCENSASNAPGKCPVCGMDLVKNPNFSGEAVPDTLVPAAPDTAHHGHDHDDHEGHNH